MTETDSIDDLEMMRYKESEIGSVDLSETENLHGTSPPAKSRFYQTAYSISNMVILLVLIAGVVILIGVTSATYQKVEDMKPVTTVTTAYASLGLPGYEAYNWEDVTLKAEGTQVNFWMWSGDEKINAWVDDWLASHVKDEYDITLTRVAVSDTGEVIEQIDEELAAGNTNNGEVDLVWINGENYNTLQSAKALYGPFANKVPSAENFDFESPSIKYDFGRTTNGYEMPYNEAQVVFIYDSAHFPSGPPKTPDELVTWAEKNPGRFAYPAPCTSEDCDVYDYTGSVFIRHFLYYYPTTSTYKDMVGDFDQVVYNSHAAPAFTKLRELEPFVYQRNGAPYYPVNISDSDAMFGSGDIWLTLSYEPAHAGQMVESGDWPETTLAYVPASGSIANTNFVAIAANAKNILGGVVVANYIGAIWSQFNRRQADQWGALQCYNPTAPALTKGGWQIAFDSLVVDPQTPSMAELHAGAMPEMVATYVDTMQSDWYKCVLHYTENTGMVPCQL